MLNITPPPLIPGAPARPATLAISKDLFFRTIGGYPQMAIEIMRELAHRLENSTAQLREARGG